MKLRLSTLFAASAAAALLSAAGAAWADDPAPAPPPPPPSGLEAWLGKITYKAQLEVGGTFNPDSPSSGLNWGHAFTDRSNQALLNGIVLTAEKDPDTSSKTIDVGFKLQASYGSDARYTELVGQFNRSLRGINQFDLVEANLQAHLPFFTAGGMEFKIGQYSTIEGAETIDPTGNFFYSHSYLFNYGIPLKHMGVLTTTHITPAVDVYIGVDTGVNTGIGPGGGPNDTSPHFLGGIGLNLGPVTVLATTHIGSENYTSFGCGNFFCSKPAYLAGTNKLRYLSDVVVTWHVNKALTFMLDGNYIYDDLAKVSGGGATAYLTYQVNSWLAVGGRAEVWSDPTGFYVAGFPGPYDFIAAEGGYHYSNFFGEGGHTYGEFTLGLNIKPQGLPRQLDGITLRPEVRYDTTFSGGAAYDVDRFENAHKSSQWTIGVDLIVPFKP